MSVPAGCIYSECLYRGRCTPACLAYYELADTIEALRAELARHAGIVAQVAKDSYERGYAEGREYEAHLRGARRLGQ